MGLQETSDILLTFLQNIVLLVSIPNANINWPPALEGFVEQVRAVVDFDLIQNLAALFSQKVSELDSHVMLILKNAFLPFIVALFVIVPLKRWYYVVWWVVTLVCTVGLGAVVCVLSFFVMKPFDLNWTQQLHSHTYIYTGTWVRNYPLTSSSYEPGPQNEPFDWILVAIFSASVFVMCCMFCCAVGIGMCTCCISWIKKRFLFRKIKKQYQARAPKGAKVKTKHLRFRLIYEEVKSKKEAELKLNLPRYFSRIFPLICGLLIELILMGAYGYWKYVMVSSDSTSAWNSIEYLVVFALVFASACCIMCCLICCNSIILFRKPRLVIFKINEFLTSKSLKLVFLVLSSFYIPLAVNVFAMFDCVKVECDSGYTFWNRKNDIAALDEFTAIYEELLKTPTVCQSCNFDQSSSLFHNTTADAHFNFPNKNEICPGGSSRRLMRSQQIECSSMYPYVATAGGLCILFVLMTPFLIIYLIRLSTTMMGSVDVSHLEDYEKRKVWRKKKNKKDRKRRRKRKKKKKGTPQAAAALDIVPIDFSQKFNPFTDRRPYLPALKDFKKSKSRNLKWEIRIALIDCSIESIYFPYKYRYRYFKIVFLIAKVILSFVNVFGLTLFGQLTVDNSIGPQVVLWATIVVQFVLGVIGLLFRPHMVLAETLLMVVSTISIIVNCAFGLALVYTKWDVPVYVVGAFMAANSLILGFATIMSLLFYLIRLRRNNYKTIQNRMKKILKAKARKEPKQKKKVAYALPPPTEKQVKRYLRGQGRKRKEPYIPVGRPARKMLKAIKTASKYQEAVGFSLNRSSLDLLINFFFFMSVVSIMAGITLGMHYLIGFLNPNHTDPYIKTRINHFKEPYSLHNDMVRLMNENFDRSDRATLRQETESLVEKHMHFSPFPDVFCEEGFNFTFAGYKSWEGFTENCFCSRDTDYESYIKELEETTYKGARDLEVEIWRCRNDIVKRRIRAMTVDFTNLNAGNFYIGDTGNYTNLRLEGYAVRGFCATNFTEMFTLPDHADVICNGKPTEVDNFNFTTGFTIAPDYVHWGDPLFHDSTPVATGVSDRFADSTVHFFAQTWDAVLSFFVRTYLF